VLCVSSKEVATEASRIAKARLDINGGGKRSVRGGPERPGSYGRKGKTADCNKVMNGSSNETARKKKKGSFNRGPL